MSLFLQGAPVLAFCTYTSSVSISSLEDRIWLLQSIRTCLMFCLIDLKLFLNKFQVGHSPPTPNIGDLRREKPRAYGFQSTCNALEHLEPLSQEKTEHEILGSHFYLTISFLMSRWKHSERSTCQMEACGTDPPRAGAPSIWREGAQAEKPSWRRWNGAELWRMSQSWQVNHWRKGILQREQLVQRHRRTSEKAWCIQGPNSITCSWGTRQISRFGEARSQRALFDNTGECLVLTTVGGIREGRSIRGWEGCILQRPVWLQFQGQMEGGRRGWDQLGHQCISPMREREEAWSTTGVVKKKKFRGQLASVGSIFLVY